ncbi:MAG: Fis family transcriptional regulator [Methylothermaceae bacteria B42]|nr:MAG: Fis family transcriptional regulator [Methylothermaceae bacteria B42]HHJ39240.1 Fis family transcriptional regulator [Methylothermaceae bacterium]
MNKQWEKPGLEGIVLKEQVRAAVEQYFYHLDGHAVVGLYAMVIAEVEKPLLEAVLAHTGGNQSKAAKVLGMSRSTLRKKMQQYEIE